MAPSYVPRLAKKTKVVKEEEEEEDDYEIGLNLTIHHAEDIDNPSTYPCVNKRIYRVFVWTTPGKEFSTWEAEGLPNPTWNLKYHIALGKPTDSKFLNVEVVRFGSKSDPGTSTGMVLVGRTRIPLPNELSTTKAGRFGLVRLVGQEYKAEGYIAVSMQVKRMEYYYY